MNKKVGFLIMNFESGGGTERVTSVIANELVKSNYQVFILNLDAKSFTFNRQI